MARYTGPMLSPIPTLQVALPVPLPRLFDYLSPEGDGPTAAVGCRLKVPFGNRELVGVVAGHGQTDDGQGLRQALAWCDRQPLLQGELWQSLQWLARYTHAPLGEVLATALPATLRRGEPLPDTVVLRPVPRYTEYRYAVVNDRRVIVEPRTRRIVKIID